MHSNFSKDLLQSGLPFYYILQAWIKRSKYDILKSSV